MIRKVLVLVLALAGFGFGQQGEDEYMLIWTPSYYRYTHVPTGMIHLLRDGQGNQVLDTNGNGYLVVESPDISALQDQITQQDSLIQELSNRVQALEQNQLPPLPQPIALGEYGNYRFRGYIVKANDVDNFILENINSEAIPGCSLSDGEICIEGEWVAGVDGPGSDGGFNHITPFLPATSVGGQLGFCHGVTPGDCTEDRQLPEQVLDFPDVLVVTVSQIDHVG